MGALRERDIVGSIGSRLLRFGNFPFFLEFLGDPG